MDELEREAIIIAEESKIRIRYRGLSSSIGTSYKLAPDSASEIQDKMTASPCGRCFCAQGILLDGEGRFNSSH